MYNFRWNACLILNQYTTNTIFMYPNVCIFNRYVPRRRPPFSALNFAYNFLKWKKYSAPEHHHFTFFAVPETIIFTAGSLQPARTSGSAPGPECQPDTVPQSVSKTPTFTLKIAPEPRIFTLELAPEPPIFHFAEEHTYQNLGWMPPPVYVTITESMWLLQVCVVLTGRFPSTSHISHIYPVIATYCRS